MAKKENFKTTQISAWMEAIRKQDEEETSAITNLEIYITIDKTDRMQVAMNTEIKKAFVSMLLNFFKDGIPYIER